MSQENAPLTIDEHRELGTELRRTTLRLQQLCGLVVGVYGPQSLTGFAFLKAMEAMNRLRHELEAQAVQDLQGYDAKDLYL